MKCFKGFDKDLKCRDFQYEIGKEYTEEKADICNCGFHACKFPMDVFGYYSPSDSRYCEVDLEANNQLSNDSKRVGKKISVKAEIGIAGIIKAGVEYIKEQVNWEDADSMRMILNGCKESGNFLELLDLYSPDGAIACGYGAGKVWGMEGIL